MPRCTFLSTDDLDGYVTDDRLAFAPLQELGWEVVERSWHDREHDWSRDDAVVVRTTWDYHRRLDEFLQVLAGIESATALFNPLSLIRWNARKTYLRDLEARGVPIVPTAWCEQELRRDWLEQQCAELGSEELVVKPQIGASAEQTFRLRRGEDPAAWDAAQQAFASRPCMVQPFLPAIAEEGESSLFSFAGEASHAVRKVPAVGDFRVQEEYGGQIVPLQPEPELRATADRVLSTLDEEPLYARVDLVRHEGRPCVLELELIEPSMYLRMDPEAPRRFAEAIDRRCR